MKSKYYTFIVLTLILAAIHIPNIAGAGSVKLSWQPNSETDMASYRVYYGTASRDYGLPIPVGNITEYTVMNLDDGKKYYFAVSAVDTSGNESGLSQEVSKQAGPVPAPAPPLPGEELITDLDVATGRSYFIKTGLESGAQAYSDRTKYIYLKVPAELENATYIQTAHRDAYSKGYNNLLSFNLNRAAGVYVILDDLNSSMPVGMEDFTDTGYDFKFYRNMSVYMKTFPAGRMTFGSNGKGDMYTILVVEK
ncbi:MAG: fibronectin type III domain-containing protein [Desulfobacteraceae bacterium]|nr:fibronectin type III domain-containing protein [Desulfobacteraceae bacterium]